MKKDTVEILSEQTFEELKQYGHIVPRDEKLSGVKVIKYNDKQSVGFKRTGPSDKFFPCALKTIQLTEL